MKTLQSIYTTTLKTGDVKNGIFHNHQPKLNAVMNRRLVFITDLEIQMNQTHWNMKGPNAIGLRKLFEKVDGNVKGCVDRIAAHIVQLGGIAEGTLRMAASRARLPVYSRTVMEGLLHIQTLARSFSLFGKAARTTIDEANIIRDTDTANLFTKVSRDIDICNFCYSVILPLHCR